jgi:hypothetical protein
MNKDLMAVLGRDASLVWHIAAAIVLIGFVSLTLAAAFLDLFFR